MQTFLIIFLLLLGLFFIVVEVLFVPGITIAGFLGGGLLIGGIICSYVFYSPIVGHCTLIGVFVLLTLLTIYFLRTKTWNKLALHAQIDAKVINDVIDIHIGDEGITSGRLAPMGKVLIKGKFVEAQSELGLIENNRPIIVSKVLDNKIIVKVKSKENDGK